MYKLLFVFQFLSLGLLAQNLPEDVKSFNLANGMKIMVLEDHSIPNANMYYFYKVGSRNEYPGITGISHFFEHMMFNGAKKFGPKMFDRTMEMNGGSNNAYTTEDLTVYTDWFPGSALETMFDLESDRIRDLTIAPEMIESERGVVLSERSTGLENSNFEIMFDFVKATAIKEHPYHWPVIGYESDIKKWSKKDLEDYFKTYYAPNNCVMVVVGDVTLDNVKALSTKYLETIPSGIPPRMVHTVEPKQVGERRIMLQKEVSTPHILLTYHTPEAKSTDFYALDILQDVLSNGNSSRLYRNLVDEKQLATEVFADYSPSLDPNLFYIGLVAADNITTDLLEKEVYDQLNEIKVKGITQKELNKIVNQKQMNFYDQMETINGKANSIGTYEMYFGDYKKLYSAPVEYAKVTLADIQRVAATYFTQENRTVGILKTNVNEK